MTAFAHDEVLPEVAGLTGRLVELAGNLTDEQVRAPSGLPGWTRGHVLAHLCRNADACSRLVLGAAAGEQWPMYPDSPSRDEEIAAGAGRGATEQRDDLLLSAQRFRAACDALPVGAGGFQVRVRSGQLVPVAVVPWMRWQELALHGEDLDLGLEIPDGPLAGRAVAETAERFGAADPRLRLHLTATDLDLEWQIGPPGGGTRLTGRSGQLLSWLSGRTGADRLAQVPAGGPLPELPAWR